MTVPAPLHASRCCLHVVDMQIQLMREINGAEEITENAAFLVRAARILNIPVVANTQYKKGLGVFVPKMEALMEGVPRPDKVEFDAFSNPATIDLLAAMPSISTWIMVGVETHICIYQSAQGALRRGLTPWIVSDAVSSRHHSDHLAGLRRLEQLGAIIGPAEMLVYELLGRAGTAQFKAMLPLVVARNGQNTAT